MISFASFTPVPADFIGVQLGLDGGLPSIDLFTLNQQLGEHPTGSTVSRETLEQHGYQVPSRDELMKTMRVRPGRTLSAVA